MTRRITPVIYSIGKVHPLHILWPLGKTRHDSYYRLSPFNWCKEDTCRANQALKRGESYSLPFFLRKHEPPNAFYRQSRCARSKRMHGS